MLKDLMNSEWKHTAEDWEKDFNHYLQFLVAKVFRTKTNEPTNQKKTTPNVIF